MNNFSRWILVAALLLASSSLWAADKRVGILVFDGVLTSDIVVPMEVFGIASKKSWFSDYDTITINVGSADTVTTEEGLKLAVDAQLNEAPVVDVLLVPSAYNMEPLLENEKLIAYIRNTGAAAEWMASNCSGAFMLAEAGVLDGKKATTWAGGEAGLKKSFPKVEVQYDTNYVIDDGVIISNGSVVSYEAAMALLEKLSSRRRTDEVRNALQMGRAWRE